MKKKKAVLLINLGTPDQLNAVSVRRYLRKFLCDPRVIDLPAFIRWPLVNLAIVPFRYKKTAAAYAQIWEVSGSPLLVKSQQLTQALAAALGDNYHVELGMRYGHPHIQSALEKLSRYDSLTVIPLFPQYSSAATGSAIEETLATVQKQWNIPDLTIIKDFHSHPAFIKAYCELINQHTKDKALDLILFSYHGLPERHVTKSLCEAKCDRVSACPPIDGNNLFCYRAQCYATSRRIAEKLGLKPEQYMVSFQSRLGRTPWIKPYTDIVLGELIQKGVKNIAVVSPSFIVDCLETLEEINIRARKQWSQLGGAEFTSIPCLNSSPAWVEALVQMIPG